MPDGWERRWHEYLRPVRVGELVVRPPWIEGDPGDLVIDPGVFFGAGTHPTTRLCLELLLDEQPGGALCDWGAGTGVLAIAAARLGWEPVTAVELDPARDRGDPRERRAQRRRGGGAGARPARGGAVGARRWSPTCRSPCCSVAGRLGRLAHDLAPATRLIASGMLAARGRRGGRRVRACASGGGSSENGWAAVVLA